MTEQPTRIYAFDHLRTTMTVMILVYHACLTYIVTDLGVIWPFKDPSGTSLVFDILMAFFTCLVMPVFFVMSGFMASLLSSARGVSAMLKNRLNRIGYPLLIGLVILFPLTVIATFYLKFSIAGDGTPLLSAVNKLYADHFEWRNLRPIHLWFLYYLFLFCLGAAAIITVLRKRFPQAAVIIKQKFAAVYSTKASPLLFAALNFVLLAIRKKDAIETPGTFSINFTVLITYALFFAFGWMLYYEKDRFKHFQKGWLFYGIVGYLFFNIKLLIFGIPGLNHLKWGIYALGASNAIALWFLLYGFIGFFLKYFNNYSARGRYLSNASYWIYLVHFPMVFFLQAAFININLSVYLKFTLVVVISLALSMLSYHYLVRDRFIGRFLNGGKTKGNTPTLPVQN